MIAKSTTPTSATPPPRKRERTANVSYPYHPLELCIQVGNAVREIGNGKAEVSRSLLASRLGISEQSADYAQKLASTKCYGIIEGKSSFTLSQAAKSYFFPTQNSEVEKKQALLTFLESPGAFARLIEKYDGSIPPSLELMGNVLHQEMGIPDSWKSRIAKFFIRSAEFSNAKDSNGFLRIKAQKESFSGNHFHHTRSSQRGESPDFNKPEDTKSPPFEPQREVPSGVVVWTYPCDGKSLRIETPENITIEVWQKLNRYMEVIKPE